MKCDYCPAPALSRAIGLCSDCLDFEHDCNADSLGEAPDATIKGQMKDRKISYLRTEDRLVRDFERGFAKITRVG
jgi:hypothetical protein